MNETLQITFIFLISLVLCYVFFAIIYNSVKKKAPNKNIADYYYKISYDSKEDAFINKFMDKLNLTCKPLFSLGYFFFILLIFSSLSMYFHSLENYILSNAALRLQKYLLSFFITLFGIVFTAITIFISSKPKFSILLDSNTILENMKIKYTFISCSICYLVLMLSSMLNYLGYYLIESEEWSMLIKLFSFWSSIIISCVYFFIIAKFLYSFINFHFSNSTEQKYLTIFYNDIYKNNLQQISKDYTADNSIKYLLNNQTTKLSNNEDIKFISIEDQFADFSIFKKAVIFILNIVLLCFFHFAFFMLIMPITEKCFHYDYKFIISESVLFIIISIIFHIIVTAVLLSKPTKAIILRALMFAWGYSITESVSKDDLDEKNIQRHTYYSCIYKGVLTNKIYNKYFQELYSVLVILKRAIITSEECAKFYLDQIVSEINAGKGDYLLYGISLYLYQEKYKLENKYKNAYLEYLKKHNLNHELVKNNMCAVLEDIDRANEAPPTNENKDKTQHEIKKENIEEKLIKLFFSDEETKKVKITKTKKLSTNKKSIIINTNCL